MLSVPVAALHILSARLDHTRLLRKVCTASIFGSPKTPGPTEGIGYSLVNGLLRLPASGVPFEQKRLLKYHLSQITFGKASQFPFIALLEIFF